MAHAVDTQVIVNNKRELTIKVHVHGDGASADLDGSLIIDLSVLAADASDLILNRLQSTLTGFTAYISWDATTPVHAYNIADYDVDQDFEHFGGIPNNAGAGKTGDVLLSTTGLTSGHGHIILHFAKVPN